jgi:hypothetical protein
MDHNDIIRLVKSMEITPLTKDTFDSFDQNAQRLFLPRGKTFQEFYSPGDNTSSRKMYNFSTGKPKYLPGSVLSVNRIESKEIPDEGKQWLEVHFDLGVQGWGIPNQNRRLPLRFGFHPGKALYIAEQERNGTPELPWETVYIKL